MYMLACNCFRTIVQEADLFAELASTPRPKPLRIKVPFPLDLSGHVLPTAFLGCSQFPILHWVGTG